MDQEQRVAEVPPAAETRAHVSPRPHSHDLTARGGTTIDATAHMIAAAAAVAWSNEAEAQMYWKLAREAPNAPVDAWILAAKSAQSIGDKARAVSLLEDAMTRFPKERRVPLELAVACEAQNLWEEASRFWRSSIQIGGAEPGTFPRLAANLLRLGRDTEARDVLEEAARLHPSDFSVLAGRATFFRNQRQFDAALQGFEGVITRFPDNWIGYRGKIETLRAMGRPEDANAFLMLLAPRFPNDQHALFDLAQAKSAQKDYRGAAELWSRFREAGPSSEWAILSHANALINAEEFAEAESVLADGLTQYPMNAAILATAAQCSERRGDWVGALQYWRRASEHNPSSLEGSIAEIALLRAQGLTHIADDVAMTAMKRLPNEPTLIDAYGLNAMARGDWAEASTRYEAAQAKFPNFSAFADRLANIRQQRWGGPLNGSTNGSTGGQNLRSGISFSASVDSVQRLTASQVADHFESLGGGSASSDGWGYGCEFALWKRHVGAETLGLLKWVSVPPGGLLLALREKFAALDNPENLRLRDVHERDWCATHKNYKMSIDHTGVPKDNLREDQARRLIVKRMTFLRDKLLQDLDLGEKLFVYRTYDRVLSPSMQAALAGAVGACGGTLFYVQHASAEYPAFGAWRKAPHLIVGSIDRFAPIGSAVEPNNEGWERVCRAGLALWLQERAQLTGIDSAAGQYRIAAGQGVAGEGDVLAHT